jgi:hypothetical protein
MVPLFGRIFHRCKNALQSNSNGVKKPRSEFEIATQSAEVEDPPLTPIPQTLQVAALCYFERIDLSAHGFYRTPDLNFDFNTGKGRPFNYFTYGAASSEVEIDTLTGDMTVRKTDIVMDLGRSLNPAIDIGQVRLRTLGMPPLHFSKPCQASFGEWGPLTASIASETDVQTDKALQRQCSTAHIRVRTVSCYAY